MNKCLFVVLVGVSALSPFDVGEAASKDATPQTNSNLGKGPIDFRCDHMRVTNKPNQMQCVGHVVLKRENMLLCCNVLDGLADDNWEWQKFICTEDVRVKRADELVWSGKAEFDMKTQDVFLTNKPLLLRGKDVIRGDRVVMNMNTENAQIEKPVGRVQAQDAEPKPKIVPASPPFGPLPNVCPLSPFSEKPDTL